MEEFMAEILVLLPGAVFTVRQDIKQWNIKTTVRGVYYPADFTTSAPFASLLTEEFTDEIIIYDGNFKGKARKVNYNLQGAIANWRETVADDF